MYHKCFRIDTSYGPKLSGKLKFVFFFLHKNNVKVFQTCFKKERKIHNSSHKLD